MSEEWFHPGAEVAEIIPAVVGPDTVHLCSVGHVTSRMIVLDNGHRYWKDTLCLVGKTDGYTRKTELRCPTDEKVLDLRAVRLVADAFSLICRASKNKCPSTATDAIALLNDAEKVIEWAKKAIVNDILGGAGNE